MDENDDWQDPAADPRPNTALIDAALRLDPDDVAQEWHLVHIYSVFYHRASLALLAQADALCRHPRRQKRRLGFTLLKVMIEAAQDQPSPIPHFGQRPSPYNTHVTDDDAEKLQEAISALVFERLTVEHDAGVLSDIANPIGFLYETERYRAACLEALLQLSRHTDVDVRFGAACALAHVHDPVIVPTLLRLMTDRDPDIRDWATFDLGSMQHADTPEIREALAAALNDEYPDVQGEALAGLACRGDSRAVEVLLNTPIEDWRGYEADALVDAGKYGADPRLLPLLDAERANALVNGKELWPDLLAAIDACRTGVPVNRALEIDEMA